jgi:UDP-2,3-diacylglucosamine pyrophosphatase LpxH
MPLSFLCALLQEMRDYVNTAKELQKMLLMLHTRSRAATTIQSTWRGRVQRRKWRPVWEAHVEQKQQLQAATVLQQVRVHAVRWAYPASGTLHCVSYTWISQTFILIVILCCRLLSLCNV